uniref:Uncharacterized protein n=1 Tax=Solanum tuberosum TaxID=4113 RepID=M1CQT5_SOLTU
MGLNPPPFLLDLLSRERMGFGPIFILDNPCIHIMHTAAYGLYISPFSCISSYIPNA